MQKVPGAVQMGIIDVALVRSTQQANRKRAGSAATRTQGSAGATVII